jgi:hypothetical protein
VDFEFRKLYWPSVIFLADSASKPGASKVLSTGQIWLLPLLYIDCEIRIFKIILMVEEN